MSTPKEVEEEEEVVVVVVVVEEEVVDLTTVQLRNNPGVVAVSIHTFLLRSSSASILFPV